MQADCFVVDMPEFVVFGWDGPKGPPSAPPAIPPIIINPFKTATPLSAMKPMAAVMENGMPRSQSARTPPVTASGMPE